MTDPRVLDRIAKLLRLARSSNVHEAAAAAARAQAIMDRHRIDASAIETDDDADRIVDGSDMPLEIARRMPRWILGLASSLAQVNGCRVYLRYRGEDVGLIPVGPASVLPVLHAMFTHLRTAVERLARSQGRGQGRRWCTGFRLGAVTTLDERLREASARTRERARDDARRQALQGDEQALARIERSLAHLDALARAVERFMAEQLDLRRRGTSALRTDADGYAKGRLAGHEVALTPFAALRSG